MRYLRDNTVIPNSKILHRYGFQIDLRSHRPPGVLRKGMLFDPFRAHKKASLERLFDSKTTLDSSPFSQCYNPFITLYLPVVNPPIGFIRLKKE